jgi:hypothetical protein
VQLQPPASHIWKHRTGLATGHDAPTDVNASQRSKTWPASASLSSLASGSLDPLPPLLQADAHKPLEKAAKSETKEPRIQGKRRNQSRLANARDDLPSRWLSYMNTVIFL